MFKSKQEVIEERNALSKKCDELMKYLSEAYTVGIEVADRDILSRQLESMLKYKRILNLRIHRLSIAK